MVITRITLPWQEAAAPLFDPTGGFLVAGLSAASSLASGVMGMQGAKASAAGQIETAQEQAKALEFQAKQRDMQSMESRASAQRDVFEKQKQAELVSSAIQARSAASGAGATDPTVVKLQSDVAGRSAYQTLMDMYGGESRARGLSDEAMGLRMTGAAGIQGARRAARGTILSGVGGMVGALGSAASSFKDVKFG